MIRRASRAALHCAVSLPACDHDMPKSCPACGCLVDERDRYCGCGYDWANTTYRRTCGLWHRIVQCARWPKTLLPWEVVVLLVGFVVLLVCVALFLLLLLWGMFSMYK